MADLHLDRGKNRTNEHEGPTKPAKSLNRCLGVLTQQTQVSFFFYDRTGAFQSYVGATRWVMNPTLER